MRGQSRRPSREHAAAAKQRELFDAIPADATIADIRPTTADPRRVAVKVGRRIVARLDRDVVQSLGLAPGVAWSQDVAERVAAAAATERASREAERLLGRRPLSARELVTRLRAKGFDQSAAHAAADAARRKGLINERAYADAVIRSATASRPAGKRLLEAKLRARGIDAGVVRDAVEEAASERDALADALKLAGKKMRSMPRGADRTTVMRRLSGHLARRGFEMDIVREAVRRAARGGPAQWGESDEG